MSDNNSNRLYELVILSKIDKQDSLEATLNKIKEIIISSGGTLHRDEDWGNRQLAYPIAKFIKARYNWINLEVSPDTISKINDQLRYQVDTVLRHEIFRTDKKYTGPTHMMLSKDDSKAKHNSFDNRDNKPHSKE